VRQRHRFRFFCQCQIQGSIEVHFQESNTANTSRIQKLPVFEKLRLFLDRELSLQGPHHAPKRLSILIDSRIISGKVDIDAPARQLCVHFPKRAHLVGTYQNMTHPGGILKMFEVIELALEAAHPGSFCQMVGFISNDSEGLTLTERRFHRFAQFPGAYPCNLAIHKRIMEGAQNRPVIF
jgi:hypothetical protein